MMKEHAGEDEESGSIKSFELLVNNAYTILFYDADGNDLTPAAMTPVSEAASRRTAAILPSAAVRLQPKPPSVVDTPLSDPLHMRAAAIF